MLKKIIAIATVVMLAATGFTVPSPAYAANNVVRNTHFTTPAEMKTKLGTYFYQYQK